MFHILYDSDATVAVGGGYYALRVLEFKSLVRTDENGKKVWQLPLAVTEEDEFLATVILTEIEMLEHMPIEDLRWEAVRFYSDQISMIIGDLISPSTDSEFAVGQRVLQELRGGPVNFGVIQPNDTSDRDEWQETELSDGSLSEGGQEPLSDSTPPTRKRFIDLVRLTLPELSEQGVPEVERQCIEQFFNDSVREQDLLNSRSRRLLHDSLAAYLRSDRRAMAAILFDFVSSLQLYLEAHLEESVRYALPHLTVAQAYARAGIREESRERLTLSDVLNVYSLIMKAPEGQEYSYSAADWRELVRFRNVIMHGQFDYLSRWPGVLATLLEFLPKIRQLVRFVERASGEEYETLYL